MWLLLNWGCFFIQVYTPLLMTDISVSIEASNIILFLEDTFACICLYSGNSLCSTFSTYSPTSICVSTFCMLSQMLWIFKVTWCDCTQVFVIYLNWCDLSLYGLHTTFFIFSLITNHLNRLTAVVVVVVVTLFVVHWSVVDSLKHCYWLYVHARRKLLDRTNWSDQLVWRSSLHF